jgi:hypothetical protein
MSKLTECNFCTLKDLKRCWGEENVRVGPSTDPEMKYWLEVQVQVDEGQWIAHTWFKGLTAHCAC